MQPPKHRTSLQALRSPKILLSDNGTVRKSVINELSKLVELSLEKSTAYSHEENGIVERANKEVLRHISNSSIRISYLHTTYAH
jgi:hypothetical protein